MGLLRLIDITFHANTEFSDTTALIKAQHSSLNYVEVIRDRIEIEVIKHIGNKATIIHHHDRFRFFFGKNFFFYIPFHTLQYLKTKQPDLVLVQGLQFPFQILVMKWLLGNKLRVMAKHHADHPPKWPKKIFHKLADRYTDVYFFTSYGNAKEWVDAGLVKNFDKVIEVPATFTSFSKRDKASSKEKLRMGEGLDYLWVGRLDANKDPLTVLEGFEKYTQSNPQARLHFIYQADELLAEMKQYIQSHPILQDRVLLHGYIAYEALPDWYSAADFFISASHREAGSAGLLEAMSCGCIPIVSSIPPAMKVIDNSKYGFYFQPGNAAELAEQLALSATKQRGEFSKQVQLHFEKEYSLPAVTEKIFQVCTALTRK